MNFECSVCKQHKPVQTEGGSGYAVTKEGLYVCYACCAEQDKMTVKRLSPFPANSNPFHHDQFHMGTRLGTNVVVMHQNHSGSPCEYLIIINIETGERIQVDFAQNTDQIV